LSTRETHRRDAQPRYLLQVVHAGASEEEGRRRAVGIGENHLRHLGNTAVDAVLKGTKGAALPELGVEPAGEDLGAAIGDETPRA